MTKVKKIALASICLGLFLSLASCGNGNKRDAMKYYKDYVRGHGLRQGWTLRSVELDKGDIDISVDVNAPGQRMLLESLSRMDRTVVARNGCPPYSSDFWTFLHGKYGKMRVWIALFGKDKKHHLSQVTCPFPEKGASIQYENTK